jgi:hypothetical protein
MYIYISF